MNNDELKKLAAGHAVSYIKSGMVIGLGTGSTSLFALKRIAELLESGELKNIIGIPSSIQTEQQAKKLNIPLATLNEYPELDLTIDGADEAALSCPERREGSSTFNNESDFSSRLDKFLSGEASTNNNPKIFGNGFTQINLIKGGGGALLREKILAQASKEYIVIIDESKYSEKLGEKWAVPVEVIPFAVETEKVFLNSINAKVTLRKNNSAENFITDEGNFILDCNFGKINNPEKLSMLLNCRAGIVEHGLFVNITSRVIIASLSGISEIS